jgi:hypothetical protein
VAVLIDNKITINQAWMDQNKKSFASQVEPVIDYLEGTSGSARVLQVFQKGLKLSEFLGFKHKELADRLGDAATALSITRIRDATTRGFQSLVNTSVTDLVLFRKKSFEFIKDVGDAVATNMSLVSFFFRVSPLGHGLEVIRLAAGVADLRLTTENYFKASTLESESPLEYKHIFANEKKLLIQSILKTLAGLVGSVLALISVIMGVLVAPPLVLLIISLLSTLIAISLDLSKKFSPYKSLDLDKEITFA